MTTEEEERVAQDKLDAAVVQFARDMEWVGFTTSYIMVVHQDVPVPESIEQEQSSYCIAMMGGHLPDHVCLGLLDLGKDRIRNVGRYRDDG